MRRNKGTFERDLELERQWMHRFTELKEIAIDASEEEEDDEDQVSDKEEDDTEEGQSEESEQDEKSAEEHVEEEKEYVEPQQASQQDILLNLQPQDVSKIFLYV